MAQDWRIERDSLGECGCPPRSTARRRSGRCELPDSGMRPYPAFIWSMAVIKRAAAEVNRDLGLLDASNAPTPSCGRPQEVIEGQLGRPVRGGPVPGRRGHLATT